MPSADAQKRPSIPHRHSSGSVSFARSPGDGLPSSVRGQKNIKFAVGQGRVGPRVSSHGKNLNRLAKLTPARPANNASTSPKQNDPQVQRNTSSGQLARNHSNVALRKNQSETSLKRNNRSSGQLTKLTRPGSSHNFVKGRKRANRPERSDSAGSKKAQATGAPSVRFDLGTSRDDDDEPELSGEEEGEAAWENYTDSRSPSVTRASTPRPNSTLTSPNKPDRRHQEGNGEPPDKGKELLKPETPSTTALSEGGSNESSPLYSKSNQAQNHRARTPQADNIASRLLKRNTSFNNAALPQVSSNSAAPVLIGNQQHSSSGSSGTIVNDNSNPEVVSRFLTSHSSSTTPHHSIFLPSSTSPEKVWKRGKDQEEEGLRRNKSFSDVPATRVSRTQQKLNLERESVVREPQHGGNPPLSILRSSRLSSANIPFYEMGDGAADGRLHPQLRHLFEQTNTEYRRIRLYQNPLAAAVKRLEEVGAVPPRSISAKPKPGSRKGPAHLSGSGDGAYGLSQSWRSHRSVKSADAKDRANYNTPTKDGQANGHARKPRVMFQGLESRDEGMSADRKSLDGHQDSEDKPQLDETRELCRRLWHKRDVGGADD